MKEIFVQCPCCRHEFLTPATTPEKDLERQGQLQLEAHPEVSEEDLTPEENNEA